MAGNGADDGADDRADIGAGIGATTGAHAGVPDSDRHCARSLSGAATAEEQGGNERLRTGDIRVLDTDERKRRRTGRGGRATSALRESYRIDGDGVAHADLEKLVNRPGFQSSARKIIERNRLLKSSM